MIQISAGPLAVGQKEEYIYDPLGADEKTGLGSSRSREKDERWKLNGES